MVDESMDVSSTTEVPFLVDVWVDVNIELFTERGRSFVKKVTVSIPGKNPDFISWGYNLDLMKFTWK